MQGVKSAIFPAYVHRKKETNKYNKYK